MDFWLIFFLWIPVFLNGHSLEETYSKGIEAYQKGIKATRYEERNSAFNEAFFHFNTLEHESGISSASLGQSLGDTYFQFGKYAWALLYYERAIFKDPGKSDLVFLKGEAKKKLGLKEKNNDKKTLYFYFPSFLIHREVLFLLCMLCVLFVLVSLKKSVYFLIPCSFIFALLLAISITYYSLPLQGIVIKDSPMYLSLNGSASSVSHSLSLGEGVEILEISDDKNWLKLRTIDGIMGYISANSVRAIQ